MRRQHLGTGFLVFYLGMRGAQAQTQAPPGEPPALPPDPPAEPSLPAVEDPETACLRMMKQGLASLRKGEREGALKQLEGAVAAGLAARIPAETQALLHYSYGMALTGAAKSTQAIAELRQAVKLAPADAELRGDLAAALLDDEQPDEAIAVAQAALLLHPAEEEAGDIKRTLEKVRRERLKERLSISASVEVGYDSNILQGTNLQGTEVQTIAGRSTGSAARTATRSRLRLSDSGALGSGFAGAITGAYQTPTAPTSQAGVPISLRLSLDGRLTAGSGTELWLGYGFSQLAQTLPDEDAYNFQQHDVTLRLHLTPWYRLFLDVSATGFANFSGLSAFTPFQGGISGTLKATLKESARWRTLLSYTHRYAASFSADDAALNSDSDELRLGQELRIRPVRIRLGYQLRDVRSGVLTTPVDYELSIPSTPRMPSPTPLNVGQYLYSTPLGYLGNQVAGRLHADLPAAFKLDFDASYEYRLYDGLYTATFTPSAAQLQLPQGTINTTPVTLPATRRLDHVVGLGLAIARELPRGFALSLAYSYLDNISNIANSLDNRSYMKHTVRLSGSYDF